MSYGPLTAEKIPHYHGDIVRVLFFAATGLAFIGIPLWGHLLPFGTAFEVIGGIILIILAGLASPHSRWVMVASTIAAAFGALLLESTAISYHSHDSFILLIVRETGALLLIAALYFSVKTLRAMVQGTIGELPRPWEFEDERAQKHD